MKYRFILLLSACLFLPSIASAEVIKKDAHYEGNLTWVADELKIQQTNITKSTKSGPFEQVKSVWGTLRISFNKKSDNSGFLITTTDVREIKKTSNIYDSSSLPMLWKSTAAYEIVDGSNPLIVFFVEKQQSKEFTDWQKKSEEYKKKRDRYNQLSYKEKLKVSSPKPFFQFKPSQQYEYKVVKEYHINLERSDKQEKEYWSVIDAEKSRANLNNMFIIVGAAALLWLVWFIVKKIRIGLLTAKRKTSDKFQAMKENKRKAEVRKIAEVAAITETVKSELNKTEAKELIQLREQIAEAIESGDYDKADSLLKLAERLKSLEK